MDDSAGPLIGWSLGTGMSRRPLDDLVEFPCVYLFKAVGEAGDGFVREMCERVGEVLGRAIEDDELRVRQSAQGNYKSVTLELFVETSDEVYSIYRAIRDDNRVKYMF